MSVPDQQVATTTSKILVIEDSQDLRSDVIEMLNMEGYNASGAENGRVGVEMARKLMPDLIVCDIMMPELDGYGALKEIRADVRTASIPFIFLTAKIEHIDQRQGMVLGADDFLKKPFMAEELLDSISAQLKKRADQLAAVERRIDDLKANIALALPHELRTPLNTIIGFSEMLQSEAQNLKPDQVAGWAGHIHTAGFRLYRMVENYLLFVRLQLMIDNGLTATLDEGVPEAASAFHSIAAATSTKYKRDDDLEVALEEAPVLAISHEHATKIVEELVDNAFKFSLAGQPVTVNGRNENGEYVLSVEDEGRGFSAEQARDINAFMQFERDHYEQQGMGLGLAIVKLMSQIYDISFEPIGEKNNGTCMTVRFKSK